MREENDPTPIAAAAAAAPSVAAHLHSSSSSLPAFPLVETHARPLNSTGMTSSNSLRREDSSCSSPACDGMDTTRMEAATTTKVSPSFRSPLATAANKANVAAAASSSCPMEITDKSSNSNEHNNSNNINSSQMQQQPTPPSLSPADTAPPPRVWEYPSAVPLPHKALLRSLYQAAMNDDEGDDNNGGGGDQQEISDLGLLSVEEVLLPAIAYQEERALKAVQSVVQRDHPDAVPQVLAARKAVYDATRDAVQACRTNRLQHRLPQQAAREAAWAQERRIQQEQLMDQQAKARRQQEEIRQQARERRIQERKDKHPVNQELWREVAYLMTEMHHLEKEERLWKEAAASLQQQQEEEEAQPPKTGAAMMENDGQQQNFDSMDVDDDNNHRKDKTAMETSIDHDQEEQNNDKKKTPTTTQGELAQMMETIQQITISSDRVEQSLQRVADMMEQSDKLRSDIYRRHESERFHGYPGEREPKDLIRLLSQEQD